MKRIRFNRITSLLILFCMVMVAILMVTTPAHAQATTDPAVASAPSTLDTITQTAQAVQQTAQAVADANKGNAAVANTATKISGWASLVLAFGMLIQSIFGKKQLASVANNATTQMQLMAANHSVAMQSVAQQHTQQIQTLAQSGTGQ